MIQPRVFLGVDIELGAERRLVQLAFCALVNQRALLAIERGTTNVGFNQVLTNFRADFFEQPAKVRQNGVVAQQTVPGLQQIPHTDAEQHRAHHQPGEEPRVSGAQNGEQNRQ